MKKIIYLLLLASILSASVMADSVSVQDNLSNTSTSSSNVITNIPYLRVVLVNQDPSTADPGSYVDVLFKVENIGTISSVNSTLELMPEYPFSLEPGASAVSELGTIGGLQTGSNAYLVRYKLIVDNNALNGMSEIKLKYSNGDGSIYNLKTFNISVSNPKTDFEIVAQDSTTLAIVNVGSNTASSVIVSVPEQNSFTVSGAQSSVVGNLNAGDYTLVTFTLLPTRASNSTSTRSNLTVDVSYTDILGIRRTVEKDVPFGSFAVGNITGRFTQNGSQTTFSGGLLYIIIGVVGIAIIVVVFKLRTRKRK